jgi:cobalt-zinc-cadmium efflux system membrane fusion protein
MKRAGFCQAIVTTLSGLLLVFSLVAPAVGEEHHHSHDEANEAHPAKGPHGGILLTAPPLTAEVTIFERGIPPEFRVFVYENQKPVPGSSVKLSLSIKRFGRDAELFSFRPDGDALIATNPVVEPHSFDVMLAVTANGKEHRWEYASYEGRTTLTPRGQEVAGVTIDTVKEGTVSHALRVYGRVSLNDNRVAHLAARFPGVVKELRRGIGEHVEKGDVLAVIESNNNLQPYELRAHLGGTVLERHATLGEVVLDSQPLFVVADLSDVWVDFQLFDATPETLISGSKIMIDLGDGSSLREATVTYLSPTLDSATQSRLIRATVLNPTGDLRPGAFVSAMLVDQAVTVPMAVRQEAIQKFRDWDVVYLTDGATFQAMPITLGRRDEHLVEILGGLIPGDRYVTQNSYLIKADIEKSGASHDH